MGFWKRDPVGSPFEPPSTIDEYLNSPFKFLIRQLYFLILHFRGPSYTPPPNKKPIRVVAISDSHTKKVFLPPGDLLIHAGDLANNGSLHEIQDQLDWLKTFPHPHKVVICGNHDGYFDKRSRRKEDNNSQKRLDWGDIHYLEHSSITLDFPDHDNRKLTIYGAPQIPKCGGRDFAFQHARHENAWTDTVPMETDILVTHTPPKYHLDLPSTMGDANLLNEAWRVKPALHVFGHVHAGYGREKIFWDGCQRTFENVTARKDAGIWGDWLDAGVWMDFVKMVYHGIKGLLWARVWKGVSQGGMMLNVSLSVRSTGKIGNPPSWVDL